MAIDKSLIDKAIEIRKEFLKANEALNINYIKVKEITNTLGKYVNDLNKIKDTLDNYADPDTAKSDILKSLTMVEAEGNKLAKLIEPLNIKIEALKTEETNLYNLIKRKYPSLKDEEIVNEFKKYIIE